MRSVFFTLLLLPSLLFASGSLVGGILGCGSVKNDIARLACFDREVKLLGPELRDEDNAVAIQSDDTRKDFGLTGQQVISRIGSHDFSEGLGIDIRFSEEGVSNSGDPMRSYMVLGESVALLVYEKKNKKLHSLLLRAHLGDSLKASQILPLLSVIIQSIDHTATRGEVGAFLVGDLDIPGIDADKPNKAILNGNHYSLLLSMKTGITLGVSANELK